MMWVYRLLDILVTLSQVAIAFSAIDILCKNPRSKFYRWIPPVVLALVAYFWTWIIEDGSFKMPTLLIVLIASCIACYRDSIRNIIVAALMGMVFMAVSESVVYLFLTISILTMAVNIVLAGADVLIAAKVLREKNVLIADHPTEAGYIAFCK